MFHQILILSLALFGASQASPQKWGWIGAASNPFFPVKPYIVGGDIVEGREFPSQISLRVENSHNCGGSILNSEWILTAGHCSDYSPSELNVVEGSNLLDNGGVSHQVVEIRVHEKFDPSDSWINDIAIMKVSPPIEMRDGVAPVKLPKKGQETPAGSTATVIGWGRTSAWGPIPNELRKVEIPIVDYVKCNSTYYEDGNTVRPTQICAGGEGGKDACNGDSGGPLFVNGEIIGIVSWGRPCAEKGYPTVFTEVSDYIDWIEEHLKA
ncbi:hypothetical protein J437_LFUL009260 [Ladona fulva]|uniref:Peptidase S1 domain-containing protein n=1 Tax=Ladona fulva TaxID=123851 RepID=A0A8K0P6A3_LADFU|nr:hypothetical protein J437_LFUL009260 [Ladona fulva]